jgi:hypothetical protein
LIQAGKKLQSDLQTLKSYPPIPDPQAQQHWSTLLSEWDLFASDAATYNGDLTVSAQMAGLIGQINAEQQAILVYLGGS